MGELRIVGVILCYNCCAYEGGRASQQEQLWVFSAVFQSEESRGLPCAVTQQKKHSSTASKVRTNAQEFLFYCVAVQHSLWLAMLYVRVPDVRTYSWEEACRRVAKNPGIGGTIKAVSVWCWRKKWSPPQVDANHTINVELSNRALGYTIQ